MPRIVVDTSVFVRGLLSTNVLSSSVQVLDLWRSGAFELVTTPQILRELTAKLIEKNIEEAVILELLQAIMKLALQLPGTHEVCRLDDVDPDDNMFLAAALESGAEFLVSNDKKHILPLKHYHGTQIVSPDLLLRALVGLTPEEAADEAIQQQLDEELQLLKQEGLT